MTDGRACSRRGFLRGATGGALAVGATGTAAAAEDGGTTTGDGDGDGAAPQPNYDGWFSDVGNYSSTADMRGQSEVTVMVGAEGNGGNFAFDPPAIHVDAGTTVVWEWTGEGNQHNVVDNAGDFESELTAEEGFTFSQTFESDGMTKYYCDPHDNVGMKGAVVVGTDYPAADTGGGGGPQQLPEAAMTLGLASTFVISVTLGLAYFFLKYGGDYDFE